MKGKMERNESERERVTSKRERKKQTECVSKPKPVLCL